MADVDQRTGTPAAGKTEAAVEAPHPSGPAAVPPDHILFGNPTEPGEDPVLDSVIADDWGYIPNPDADVEGTETHLLREGTVI